MAPRRFERSVFLALLTVALIPTALVVAGGAWALGDVLARSGSAGPWVTVAGSGLELIDRVERDWPEAQPVPAQVSQALEAHRTDLVRSRDMSRLYAAVAARALDRLPLIATGLLLFVTGLAWATAHALARRFARPVHGLIDWTGRIAAGDVIPEGRAVSPGFVELEQLGDALRSMSRSIDEGRRKAVEAARLATWSAMARRAAHEIKNPLTPMKLAAYQIRKRLPEDQDDGSVDVLVEEIDRLDALARSFVQVGRAPEGPAAMIDLVELCRALVDGFASAPVPVMLDAPPNPVFVRGHLDALRGALLNLIGNAVEAQEGVQASPDAGVVVQIRTVADAAGAAAVRITVEDDGPGLPAGLEDAIWNLDVTTKRRGSGIGLPMVRQTLTSHGGHVRAENRPEGGARFVCELPRAPLDLAPASPAP
ncbi:MAG: HAMP domain-containing sensor histidine kinase [Gemmatimonadota bacterium]